MMNSRRRQQEQQGLLSSSSDDQHHPNNNNNKKDDDGSSSSTSSYSDYDFPVTFASAQPAGPIRISGSDYGSTDITRINTLEAEDSLLVEKMSMDEAIERLGYGPFQRSLLWATGLCMAATGLEVLLLSFLTLVLQQQQSADDNNNNRADNKDWELTTRQTSNITSCVFLGALIGSLVLGRLADIRGRRPLFLVTAGIIAVFGLATGLAPNYYTLLMCRSMVGFAVGGLIVPFDTLSEFLPKHHRGRNLLLVEYFWTAGALLVVICSYFTLGHSSSDEINNSHNNTGGDLLDSDSKNMIGAIIFVTRGFSEFWGSWRIFVMVCSIPCFISLFWAIYHVPESPRWLMTTKGDQESALKILRQAATINGHDPYERFPETTILLREGEDPLELNNSNDHQSHFSELREMFGPRWLKITLALWGCWFGEGILYYGTVIVTTMVFGYTGHHQNDDPADDNLTTTYQFDYGALLISNAAEIVGVTIIVMTIDSWGRIRIQWISYLANGICVLMICMLQLYNSDGQYRILLVILAFGARMLTMVASCTTWVSTAEVLTTDIRATGHSSAYAMTFIGAFICPYIVSPASKLSTIGYFMILIGCFTSFCAFHIPETMVPSALQSGSAANGATKMAVSKRSFRYILCSFLWIAFLLLQLTLFSPLEELQPPGSENVLKYLKHSVAVSNSNTTFSSPLLHPPRKLQTTKRKIGDALFNNIDVYLRKSNPEHDLGSNVHCIGRDLQGGPDLQANFSWMFRSCHFHQLCLNTETSEFVLLNSQQQQQQQQQQSSALSQQEKELALGAINPRWSDRGGFVQGPHKVNDKGFHKVKWFPREVDIETIPSYYELPGNVILVPFHSMAAHNVGHLLWDDFYPIFTLLKLFGFIPNSNNEVNNDNNPYQYLLLRWSPKDELYATCSKVQKKKSCKENLMRFLPLLGIDPGTFSTVKQAQLQANPNSLVQRPPQSHWVCSKQAVAGLGMLMDHGMKDHGWTLRDPNAGQDLVPHNIGRGGIFHQFRDFMVQNMGFPLGLYTKQQPNKITFSTFSSGGFERRLGFQNQSAALQKALFSTNSNNNNLHIQSIVMKELSIKEQIQVALESAIFITVSGGGAVTGTFLPPGSTLIVYYLEDGGYDFWDHKYTYTPARLDWDLLGNAGHLRVHWLPIKSMESEEDLKVLEQLVLHDIKTMELL